MASNEDVRLSELVDGELAFESCVEVIGAVKGSQRLEQRLAQYYLIRDAIKFSLPDSVEHDLRARVQRALESESPLNVVDIPKPKSAVKHFLSPKDWFNKSYAVAASVLAVGMLSLMMVVNSPDTDILRTVAVTTQPVTKVTQQVTISSQQSQILTGVQPRDNQLGTVASIPRILIGQPVTTEQNWARIQVVPRLDAYIIERSELVSSPGVSSPGTFPFARVVSFGDNTAK